MLKPHYKRYRVAFLGFGNVGRALARLLVAKSAELRERYGIEWDITGVATRRMGWRASGEAIDVSNTDEIPIQDGIKEWLATARPDVLFETTSLNPETGQPAIDYLEKNGVDQIAKLVTQIKTNPDSRRLIVTGWDPRQADNVDLPPCHTLFQFKVESGKILHCQLYQRSADAFLGVPFNISSYALLTHMIAHVTELEVGDFVYTLGDYHIYNNHRDQVNELLSREPFPLPQLTINSPELRGLDGLLQIKYENLELTGYKSHGKIAAPVAV